MNRRPVNHPKNSAFRLWAALCSTFLIAVSLSAGEVPWSTANVIGADFLGAQSVFAADIDGDGDSDALGAALLDDTISWWENTTGDGSAWTSQRTPPAPPCPTTRSWLERRWRTSGTWSRAPSTACV